MKTSIKSLDSHSFILTNPKIPLLLRIQHHRTKQNPFQTINNYVAGNFSFIYKNLSQIEQSKIQDLSDILFTHTFFCDTSPLWNLLFCVTVHGSDEFICPICLFKPVAPRIGKCGHFFCADCIRLLFEKSSKHICPVCYEPIFRNDIIRANLIYHPPLSTNCRFKKIWRFSKLNVCCSSTSQSTSSPNSPYELFRSLPKASNENSLFTHFSIVDDDFAFKIINQEIFDIDNQISEMITFNDSEKIQALQSVRQLIAEEKQFDDETEFQLIPQDSTFSGHFECFYQIEDGRLIFLDPLNVQMIEHSFGEDIWPDIIEGQIISQTHITIDENYDVPDLAFKHLHSGSEVTTILLDIDHLLKPETVAQFKNRINSIKQAEEKKKQEQLKAKSTDANKRVITSKDYQTFVPIVEPPITFSEEEFPSLSSLSQPIMRKPAPPIKIKEDFPSLDGNAQPISTKGVKKNWGGTASTTSQSSPIYQQQFPSLATSQPPQKKKKVAAAWGNLKL